MKEFLHRPTAPADWWPEPASHVLGSRDLARSVQGTWMGVTRHGKIAVLTNYRESSSTNAVGLRSRGSIINSFLKLRPEDKVTTQQYTENLVSSGDAQQAGGFSLACGDVMGPLAIVSNRMSAADGIAWAATEKGQTVGLSNTAFGDRSWPKISNGEEFMKEALRLSYDLGEDENDLIKRLLRLLSTDTLPRLHAGADVDTYVNLLCESIFIPVIGGSDEVKTGQAQVCNSTSSKKVEVVPGTSNDCSYLKGLYGTQTQTVILVHTTGRVKFFERTLFNEAAEPIPIGEGDREFEFMVER
ncbi:hypothetical protein FQN57_001607 [Myotisia sp. PD_48]|nr:hypothetical protein FQN57_001607 [Myotisia sp. PD_48]